MENELKTLLTLAKSGDETAFADLAEKYKPLIVGMGKNYSDKCSNSMYSLEDFVQEATVGFYSAVQSYEESDKVTFGLYAKVCVRNRLVSLLRAAGKKVKPPKESGKNTADLSALLFGKEDSLRMQEKIRENLSPFEWKVFCLYIEKRSYAEMAEIVGKPIKSVDNALFRIKKKLRFFL